MKVFHGTLVHSTHHEPVQILSDRLIGVDNQGKIVFIGACKNKKTLAEVYKFDKADIINLQEGEFLLPGLIDTHIHASQYVYTGTGLDLPLLEWLEKYTFPTEACYKDDEFAKMAYTKAVKCVLSHGTTTACYFGTIHLGASKVLADVVEEQGQRAYVGKVCMDQNSPDYYIEDTLESVKDTERFVQYVQEKQNDLVTPVVTPRFAITGSGELLSRLGKLAEKHHLPVQSHLSETKAECSLTCTLHPDSQHYTDIYDRAGLLRPKTVMAHCVYLSDEEIRILKDRGVGVSHCPNSNLSICSGLLNVRKLLNAGLKVGLGTDVSGGYSPSILNSIRCAIHTSNTLHIQEADIKKIDFREGFRLATLGGAEVLGLENKIGNFEVGKQFDALRVSTTHKESPIDVFARDSFEDVFQKFIHLGDDRNIREVYVAGKLVCKKE